MAFTPKIPYRDGCKVRIKAAYKMGCVTGIEPGTFRLSGTSVNCTDVDKTLSEVHRTLTGTSEFLLT